MEEGGFIVLTVLMDNEFEKTKELLPQVKVKMTTDHEHVGEIEFSHQTTKEFCRTIRHTLPYEYLPKKLVINLVYFVLFWKKCLARPKQNIGDILVRGASHSEKPKF